LTTDRIVSPDGLTTAVAQDDNNFLIETANGPAFRVDSSVPQNSLIQGTTQVQVQSTNVQLITSGTTKVVTDSTGVSIGSGLAPTAVLDIVGTYPALRMRDGFEQSSAVMQGTAAGYAYWDAAGSIALPLGGLFYKKGVGPPFNVAFGAIDTPVLLNPTPNATPFGVYFQPLAGAELQYQPNNVTRVFTGSVSVSMIGTAGDQITVLLYHQPLFNPNFQGIVTMTGGYVSVSFEFQDTISALDILQIAAFNSTSTNSIGIGSLTWTLT
jgi:hypothetical protein